MRERRSFRIVKWLFVVAMIDIAGSVVFILSYPRWYFMIPAVLVAIKAHIMFAAVNAGLSKDAGLKEVLKAYMPDEEICNQNTDSFRKSMVYLRKFTILAYGDPVIYLISWIVGTGLSLLIIVLTGREVNEDFALGAFIWITAVFLIESTISFVIMLRSTLSYITLIIKKIFF
ncbi:MAG: hypothetical protein D6694_13315 [Gammaproteobacteria bacterium]|nr:MAG: hypothetical protein D6694_13315 [Gammaproteobacteria bacterium]